MLKGERNEEMSRKVFVLTNCDGGPQRVIANKKMANSILIDDLEACGVEDNKHQVVELELEYEKQEHTQVLKRLISYLESQMTMSEPTPEFTSHNEKMSRFIDTLKEVAKC